MKVISKKNILSLLNNEITVIDTSLNFKVGDVIRAKYTPPFSNSYDKERPVVIFTTPDDMGTSVFSCIPITSNPNISGSIPFILNGKISFINTLEEFSLRRKSIFGGENISTNVIAGIPDYILDMIRYIKIKRISNLYDEDFETAIDNYMRYIFSLIKNNVYSLYRNDNDIISGENHSIFDYIIKDESSSDEDVSSYDDNDNISNESKTLNIHETDMISDIQNKLYTLYRYNEDQFYYIDQDGYIKVHLIRHMNIGFKSEMLLVFARIGTISRIMEVFKITRNTVSKYSRESYEELLKVGVEIPDEIKRFVNQYK